MRAGVNSPLVLDFHRHYAATIQARRGVIVRTVINNFTFGGSTTDTRCGAPFATALLAFMAALSQAQAEATKAAQRAGIDHARQQGQHLGRKPSSTREQLDAVLTMLALDRPIAAIARETGLTRQTVLRPTGRH